MSHVSMYLSAKKYSRDWEIITMSHRNGHCLNKKNVSLLLLCDVQHSIIMADFIMPETQQPVIVIILITYSPYTLKDLVEL